MYSQRDPRWGDIRLGTSRSTIGSQGCLVTVMAEILYRVDLLTDPAMLNRWLVQNAGFTNGNRFVFNSIADLGFHLVSFRNWRNGQADIATIDQWIRDGMQVVVEVKFKPWGSGAYHWLRVLAMAEDDLRVHDPWMPPEAQGTMLLLPRYARPSWNLARAIYRGAAYERRA